MCREQIKKEDKMSDLAITITFAAFACISHGPWNGATPRRKQLSSATTVHFRWDERNNIFVSLDNFTSAACCFHSLGLFGKSRFSQNQKCNVGAHGVQGQGGSAKAVPAAIEAVLIQVPLFHNEWKHCLV